MIRHLFVPGLLGPIAELEQVDRPALPQLENLLARADRLGEPVGYAAGLFGLFGVQTPADGDLPTAAVSFVGDLGEAPAGFLLHADPLQLLPDRDRLLAFGLDDDPLDTDELAELVDKFNAHFGDDGLYLQASPGGRIYLHCEREPRIRTHPLSTVIGRSLGPCLPDGADRRHWHSLINEAQMLCYALEFNRERESLGRSTLGGLWFSGGGSLPPRVRGTVDRLDGDCVLASGLMALADGVGEDELVVEHAAGRAVVHADPGAWLQALTGVEGLLPELLRACEALHVHVGNGTVYRWNAGTARRFWRRRRSLFDCLDTEQGLSRDRDGDMRV